MKISLSKIFYSLLLVFIFSFFFYKFFESKINCQNYSLIVESIHSTKNVLDLYYDVGNGFNELDKKSSNIVIGKNISVFNFNNNSLLKKIRLDLGSNYTGDSIEIESLKLQSNGENIFYLKRSDLLENIEYYSSSVKIYNNKIYTIENSNSFDPYIQFKSINRLIIPNWVYFLILVSPFLIFHFISIFRELKGIIKNKEIDLFFIILFILSIPLKEAWTTIVVLIWTIYLLYSIAKERVFEVKISTIILITLFFVPLIFGRTLDYNKINILLSFLIFGLISFCPIKRNINKIYRVFSFVAIVLACVIIASWLNYFIYYSKFDNVSLVGYFEKIKDSNENIREWIYFSHPAYVSIFCITGMYFYFEEFKQRNVEKKQLLVIIFITLFLVLVLGSRVALFIFLVISVSYFQKIFNYKKSLLLAFLFLSIFSLSKISSLDSNRTQLWTLSLNGIKQSPFFGYGLKSSESIILNEELNRKSGYISTLNFNHVHNQYLSYILEIGIIGFIFLFLVIFKINFKYNYALKSDYFTILFIWCTLSMTESTLETSKPTFLFCFLLLITLDISIFKQLFPNQLQLKP